MKDLNTQWTNWLNKITTSDRLFTKELYETLSTQGSMIAHFNREGFIKARFRTLRDFDHTIESMRASKNLRHLIDATAPDLLANARYKIASLEASLALKQAEILKAHAERLQSQFMQSIA